MIQIKGGGEPIERKSVTKNLRDIVTKMAKAVTKPNGRPPKFRNGAERQKAYRARRKND